MNLPIIKHKRAIAVIMSALILVPTFIYVLVSGQKNEIQAVDHLLVEYESGGPTFPIFFEDDFKPGDCSTETVTITHLQDEDVQISVRSIVDLNEENIAGVFSIVITENGSPIYGEGSATGPKTLEEFFNDSVSQLPFSTFNGQESKTYVVTICFDIDAGNEYQKKVAQFDLIFFEELPPIDIPEECLPIAPYITEVIYGTEGSDDIHGTIASELIISYGGNDDIDPSSGHDCVVTGEGNDYVQHSTGNEVILGGPGDDDLEGGDGNDIIYGGPGKDRIDGGSDNDIIYGEGENDRIDAGSGDDLVYGGSGEDRVNGGSGSDTIYGGDDYDRIDGDSGNDFLYGEGGDDEINGSSGDDYLNGGPGTDELDGDSDTDTCEEGEDLTSCEL